MVRSRAASRPDLSGSGYGMRFFMRCIRKGLDYEESVKLLSEERGTRLAKWYRDYRDEEGERQFKRAWEEAEAKVAGQSDWQDEGALEVLNLEDLQLKRAEWLWPNYIPLGKTALLAGDPERGKSTVAFDLAARVTCGGEMPDGSDGRLGSVIILSDEDDPSDTIGPRLVAAGVDKTKVKIVKMVKRHDKRRMFSLIDDLPKLEKLVERIGDVRLIVIDPVNAYLGIGKIDTFRNSDVRSVLAPLRDFAAKHRLTVLMITHTKKRREDGVNPIFHILDSIAFSAAPRSVMMIEPDVDDKKVMVFAVVKCNLVPKEKRVLLCFNFKSKYVADAGNQASINWHDEPSDLTLEDLFTRKPGRPSDARERAKQFLNEKVKKETPASEIREAAEKRGLSWSTVSRAADDLGFHRGRLEAEVKLVCLITCQNSAPLLTSNLGVSYGSSYFDEQQVLVPVQSILLARQYTFFFLITLQTRQTACSSKVSTPPRTSKAQLRSKVRGALRKRVCPRCERERLVIDFLQKGKIVRLCVHCRREIEEESRALREWRR
jgi:hypothetical protein